MHCNFLDFEIVIYGFTLSTLSRIWVFFPFQVWVLDRKGIVLTITAGGSIPYPYINVCVLFCLDFDHGC